MRNKKLFAALIGFVLAIIVSVILPLSGCAKPETYRDTVEVIDCYRTHNYDGAVAVVIYQNEVHKVFGESNYQAAKMHLNQPAEAIIEVRGDKVRVKEVLP